MRTIEQDNAYIAYVGDKSKTGWDARSFFDAGYQAALEHKLAKEIVFGEGKIGVHTELQSSRKAIWLSTLGCGVVDAPTNHTEATALPPEHVLSVMVFNSKESCQVLIEALTDLYPGEPEVSQPVDGYLHSMCKIAPVSGIPNQTEITFQHEDMLKCYLAPLDYEALKHRYDGAIESIREHQKIGGELKAENEALKAEIKALKLRVAEYKASAEQDAKTMTKLHHDKERLRGVLFEAETDRDNAILERDKLRHHFSEMAEVAEKRGLFDLAKKVTLILEQAK